MPHRTILSPLAAPLSAFLILVFSALPAATEESPSAVVDEFHQDLLVVMKEAKALGIQGRYDYLADSMALAFDMGRMVRIAVGGFWRKASPEQRKTLVVAFERMSVTTYAEQFDSYSGQAFETIGERPGPQKTVLVETRIIRPGEGPANITYVMKKVKDRWRIADVLLDNSISQLAVRRSEYRGVLKSRGVDGLVTVLNDKSNRLIAQ